MEVKDSQRTYLEIVGLISVVLSLVFVGIQLLLDRRIAEAEIYSDRAESIKEDIRALMANEVFIESRAELWASGFRPDSWSPELEEFVTEQNYSHEFLQVIFHRDNLQYIHWDNLFYQYSQGLLSEEIWMSVREGIKSSLRNPLQRYSYAGDGMPISTVIDELISEIDEGET